MNSNYTETDILQYLANGMSSTEREAFEAALQTDTELKRQTELHRMTGKAEKYLAEMMLRQELLDYIASGSKVEEAKVDPNSNPSSFPNSQETKSSQSPLSNSQKSNSKMLRRYFLGGAASALATVGIVMLFFMGSLEPHEIFDDHNQKIAWELAHLRGSEDSLVGIDRSYRSPFGIEKLDLIEGYDYVREEEKARRAFRDGDYDQALFHIQYTLQYFPMENVQAPRLTHLDYEFLWANTLFRMAKQEGRGQDQVNYGQVRYDQAQRIFTSIIEAEDNEKLAGALFGRAMIHLANRNKQGAKEDLTRIIEDRLREGSYDEWAEDVLQDLNCYFFCN